MKGEQVVVQIELLKPKDQFVSSFCFHLTECDAISNAVRGHLTLTKCQPSPAARVLTICFPRFLSHIRRYSISFSTSSAFQLRAVKPKPHSTFCLDASGQRFSLLIYARKASLNSHPLTLVKLRDSTNQV